MKLGINLGFKLLTWIKFDPKPVHNKYYLLTESEVITGKSQTEALMY